jgi:predicted transcriptional regulator
LKAAGIIRPKECLQMQHLGIKPKGSQLRINVNSSGGCHHRDKFDIIVSILCTANGNEVKQSEILVRAKITHNLFKDYLSFLCQNGLIEYMQLQRAYRTTTKGIRFLSICNKMRTLI